MKITFSKIVSCLAVAAFIFFSCSCSKKEEKTPGGDPDEEIDVQPGHMAFEAVFSEAFSTKAVLEDLKPVWKEGDKISVFGADGSQYDLSMQSLDGSKAVFEGEAPESGPYAAIYPAGDGLSYQDGKIVAEIPAVQTLAADSNLPDGTLVNVAYAASAESKGKVSLNMLNACSLIDVALEDEGITAAAIFSKDGTPIAGKVSIDPASGEATVIEGVDCITLKPSGETFSSGRAYVSVLPGTYPDLIILYSLKGEVRKGEWSADGSLTLARSGVQPLGEVNELARGYFIANADDLMAWKADKANWNAEGDIITFIGDVDLKDELWEPVTDTYPGSIEGNGHKISHFHVENTTRFAGFFGSNYTKAVNDLVFGSVDGRTYDGTSYIKGACADGSSSDSWTYAGIFTYTTKSANVKNVINFVPITVTASNARKSRVGGIFGWIEGSGMNLEGCENYGEVVVENHPATSAYTTVGGILGGVNGASVVIRNCTNHANVTSKNKACRNVGGIIGMTYSATPSLMLENCVNEGDIKMLYSATQDGSMRVGGIAGAMTSKPENAPFSLKNCINRGNVYSEAVNINFVGGIVGQSEGASLDGCINEGEVAIDQSSHPAVHLQSAGGLAGVAGYGSGYGKNSIVNSENKGKVSVKAASSGHPKAPTSSTVFYGTNAAGILGLACQTEILASNSNSGAVEVENAYEPSSADFPAVSHAGGIVGYDYGTIESFIGNSSTGAVSAKTTKSTSVASQAYAGGVVGRLNLSAMIDGRSKGAVSASAAGGSAYAGSIAGSNDGPGTIVSCVYGGTVNGAAADAANTVGRGNAPLSSSEDGGQGQQGGGEFAVSLTEATFPGTGYTPSTLVVLTGQEAVTVSKQGLDWLSSASIPSEIEAGKTVVLSLVPASGNVYEKREGTLTFKEKTSGTEKSVKLTQKDLYTPVNGFPVKWYTHSQKTYASTDAARRWTNEHVGQAVAYETPYAPETGAGTAYISAVPANGASLRYTVDLSSSSKTICLGNLGEGDCIHFSVPVVSLPAGTDVDFMLTISTANNATPKYWLFEYWDGTQWKGDERYTAKEDGSTKYSFYVYKFSSVNYRTFITSFTLPQAVNNDFVKMRIRAVGNINCNGNAITRTSSALIYLAATTSPWVSCVIAAYPEAPAVKDRTKIMQLGNSNTFVYGSAFYLKQLCRAGGHQTDVRINLKGSNQFQHHLEQLQFSQEVTSEGGYDKAILQDGGYYHGIVGYGSSSIINGRSTTITPEYVEEYTKKMSTEVLKYSPDCDVILENLFSFSYKSLNNWLGFGSYDNFDHYMWIGVQKLAAADTNLDWISPIGHAFRLARNKYGFTSEYNYLNWTDKYHGSRYGMYLKACVDYLILFGDDFGDNIHSDCDLVHENAVKLRAAAKEAVFGSDGDPAFRNNFKRENVVNYHPSFLP